MSSNTSYTIKHILDMESSSSSTTTSKSAQAAPGSNSSSNQAVVAQGPITEDVDGVQVVVSPIDPEKKQRIFGVLVSNKRQREMDHDGVNSPGDHSGCKYFCMFFLESDW